MKTVEEKKKAKLPRYIRVKELEDHLNSKEMKNLLKKLEENEENLKKQEMYRLVNTKKYGMVKTICRIGLELKQ